MRTRNRGRRRTATTPATRSRSIGAVCLAAILALSVCSPAFADPIADKKAQASAVETQIGVLDKKAEIATEDYNAARDRFDALSSRVHSAEKTIARLKAHTSRLQTALNTRADWMYRDGPLGFVSVLLSARTFTDFATTIDLLSAISARDSDTVARLKQAKLEAVAARAILMTAKSAAAKQKAAMASHARVVRAQLAARTLVLSGLQADIRQLIAERQAAEAAAARQRYLALLERQRREAAESASRSHQGGGGSSGIDMGGDPPTSSKGAAAVWWAEKAIGRPYVWAASGPNSFDCSGLTMWAYRQVGVSLPHHSGDQINRGARVSRSNLQPGDLVFFGSPIHHVGMYVGGGDFIEAPHAGSHVRIASLGGRGDYVGACRP